MEIDEDLNLFPRHSLGQILPVEIESGLLLITADVISARRPEMNDSDDDQQQREECDVVYVPGQLTSSMDNRKVILSFDFEGAVSGGFL